MLAGTIPLDDVKMKDDVELQSPTKAMSTDIVGESEKILLFIKTYDKVKNTLYV